VAKVKAFNFYLQDLSAKAWSPKERWGNRTAFLVRQLGGIWTWNSQML